MSVSKTAIVDQRWKNALARYEVEFLPYYETLEEQFLETTRFVHLNEENGSCYSMEYSKLLQAICAEVDVLAKAIASLIDAEFKPKESTIQKWGLILQEHYPEIEHLSVKVSGYGVIAPWRNWQYECYQDKKGSNRIRLVEGSETPSWWTAYNKVKHERTALLSEAPSHFPKANQSNTIYALAALYTLSTMFVECCVGNDEKRRAKIISSELF